jgi:phosphate transport system permease protein
MGPYTALPIQIYQWIARPQDEFHALAAGAIIVLLLMLLSLNAFAIWLRNRYQKKW